MLPMIGAIAGAVAWAVRIAQFGFLGVVVDVVQYGFYCKHSRFGVAIMFVFVAEADAPGSGFVYDLAVCFNRFYHGFSRFVYFLIHSFVLFVGLCNSRRLTAPSAVAVVGGGFGIYRPPLAMVANSHPMQRVSNFGALLPCVLGFIVKE